MKPSSLAGVALAALATVCLLVSTLVPLLRPGRGFSESVLITVSSAGTREEVVARVREAAGVEPKVVAESDGFLVLELGKSLSDELDHAVRQSLSGEVTVLPISPEFSVGTTQLLAAGVASFILVGIVASVTIRRKRVFAVFPLACLLTPVETVAILMPVFPVGVEMLMSSLLAPFILVMVSSVFLLSPPVREEGSRRMRTYLLILFAGFLSAIISFLALQPVTGVMLAPIASSAVGAVVASVNLLWLCGDLLRQPEAREVILRHVSF